MRFANYLVTSAIALTVGMAPSLAFGQLAAEPGMPRVPAIPLAATSPTVPAEKAAPGAPGSSLDVTKPVLTVPADPTTVSGKAATGIGSKTAVARGHTAADADYVAKKIADAESRGKDVSVAEVHEAMGREALHRGMGDEAAQHLEIALRAVGAIPKASGNNSDEGNSQPMPEGVHKSAQTGD